jgi:hypothetical protein
MDSPGTWESLCATHFQKADGAVAENGAGPGRNSPPTGSEHRERGKWGRRSEYISNAAFVAGRLSALIVLGTSGNAARADPAEGSGAPL